MADPVRTWRRPAGSLDSVVGIVRGLERPRIARNHLTTRERTDTSLTEAILLVAESTQVYFTHSYAAPVTPETAATCAHGAAFAAAVERDHIFGVQFHPEKSSDAGIRILRNFIAAAV